MAYEQIIYEVAENIATITLNRPEKLNAFTGIMMNEMIDAFDKADADDIIDRLRLVPDEIDAVMDAQKDLVEIVHTLRQVVCVKG